MKTQAYATKEAPHQLVEKHGALVKRIAQHLLARLPSSVILDDLIQSGMLGLLEAAQKFDGSKGASFETFAGIRIRGAMLDEIRRGDWVPRSVHKNSRLIAQATAEIEKETGNNARDKDIALKLGVSLEEYHSMLKDVSCGYIIGVEDLGVSEDVLVDPEQNSGNQPLDEVSDVRFKEALIAGINLLPEREALVLSLYYDEELNLREIGEVLSISESRVSQIHSQAMIHLKLKMQTWLT